MKSVSAPDQSPRYRALLQLLRAADTLWHSSRVFFAEWDLSPSQFNILNLLRLSPDGLSQSDLSRELITHRSNVTGLIDRLERRGLVRRRDVASDRRAYQVVLTPAGRRLLEAILPRYYEGAARICEHLTPRRAAGFIADLERVTANAQRAASETTQKKPETRYFPPDLP